MNAIVRMYPSAVNFLCKIDWLPPLMARLAVGHVFFLSGRGKISDLDKTAGFFEGLGIPFPYAQAVLVSILECVGGVLVMAGLMTRLISIPLAVIMGVAIWTAQWAEVGSLGDFTGLSELLYLIIFLWLCVAGAGKASLDELVSRRFQNSVR